VRHAFSSSEAVFVAALSRKAARRVRLSLALDPAEQCRRMVQPVPASFGLRIHHLHEQIQHVLGRGGEVRDACRFGKVAPLVLHAFESGADVVGDDADDLPVLYLSFFGR
jgi:hypothetical protein